MLGPTRPGSACGTQHPFTSQHVVRAPSAFCIKKLQVLRPFLGCHVLCNKCQELPAHSMTSGKPVTLSLQAAPTSTALTRAGWFSSSVCVAVSDGRRYPGNDQPPLQRDLPCFGMLSVVITCHCCFCQPLDIRCSCTIAKSTSHMLWVQRAPLDSLSSQDPAGVGTGVCPVLFTPSQVSSLH